MPYRLRNTLTTKFGGGFLSGIGFICLFAGSFHANGYRAGTTISMHHPKKIAGHKCGRIVASVCLLVIALGLSGCAGGHTTGAFLAAETEIPGASEHTILVASTRELDATSGTYYGTGRGDGLTFAYASISVPPGHKPGKIEWPSSFPGDPSRHFVANDSNYISGKKQFQNRINEELARRAPDQRNVFVFIHGYNTTYAEAVFRNAQLAHDTSYSGLPILFTWGSSGETLKYLYDVNSTIVARDALVETLEAISQTNVNEIVIMSHSLGSFLLLEAIRQKFLEQNPLAQSKVRQVIIAAPDIDVDVFKSQMKQIGKPDRPFIVLVSKDDRALIFSQRIAGGVSRVGAYENDEELAELGAIVVDVTKLESNDAARHGRFTDAGSFVPLVAQMLSEQGIELANTDLAQQGSSLRPSAEATQDPGVVTTVPPAR